MDFLRLLTLGLWIKLKNLIENFSVACRFYRNLSFAKVDLYLLWQYLFKNPFTISRQFFEEKEFKEEYIYGETPLTTFYKIAKEADITAEDVVYELGCGRGRVAFFLSQWVGCKVIGVDLVEDFIIKANKVKNHFHLKNVEFYSEDFLETDFKEVTVIYLYGTCLEEDTILKLSEKFKKLSKNTKIITVSYALSDYLKDSFPIQKSFEASFTWGKADVFIQSI